jgi:hypothetical protein
VARFQFERFSDAHLFDGVTFTLNMAVDDSRTTIAVATRWVTFSFRNTQWQWSGNDYDVEFSLDRSDAIYRVPMIGRVTRFNVPNPTTMASVATMDVTVQFYIIANRQTSVFFDCMQMDYFGHLPTTPATTTRTTTTRTTTTTQPTSTSTTTTTIPTSQPPRETTETERPALEPTTTTTTTTVEETTTEATTTTAPPTTTMDLTTTEDSNFVIVQTRGSLPFMFGDPVDHSVVEFTTPAPVALSATTGDAAMDETPTWQDQGMWIGIGVGAFVLLCLAVGLVCLVHRRRDKRMSDDVATPGRVPLERRPTAVAQVRPIEQQQQQRQHQYGAVAPLLLTQSSQYDLASVANSSPRGNYEQPNGTFHM